MHYSYRYFSILLMSVFSGCSLYHAAPLSHDTSFKASPADIKVETSKLSLLSFQAYHFPSDGSLDETGVAILAVLNNPDLKLSRADAKISHAQSFSASLLPDPQLGFTNDFPITSGSQTAYGLTASYDVGSLLKLPSTIAASRSDNHKTDLTLLWQELQTISQARILFSKTVSQDRTLTILNDYYAFLSHNRGIIVNAVAQHQLTHDGANAALAAYDDITSKHNDAQKQAAKDHKDLNAFLGLDPNAVLKLSDKQLASPTDTVEATKLLDSLPGRRPDLIALEYGYKAEDERYFQAILGQFPLINAGYNRARDNSGINSQGFAVTLNLPIFNGNRGAIAVEKATRERLREEYQIRINKAYEEVMGILAVEAITKKQQMELLTTLQQWQVDQTDSDAAFSRNHIDLFTYVGLKGSYVAKQLEAELLNETLAEQRIAIDTLLAKEMPVSRSGKKNP